MTRSAPTQHAIGGSRRRHPRPGRPLDARYHQAVANFVPPSGAIWRGGGTWSPGLIIAHNDAASYNAAWHQGKLTGFFDWDFAGPATPEWDLALAAFSWVPLHTRHWVAAEGFTDFAARPGRLGRFLGIYGWSAVSLHLVGGRHLFGWRWVSRRRGARAC